MKSFDMMNLMGDIKDKNLQFSFQSTPFDDVFLIQQKFFSDHRGSLIKLFEQQIFEKFNIDTKFNECYYSNSPRDVLRGLHFQKYPSGHAKLITVLEGKILDVIVGISKKKNNVGKVLANILSKEKYQSLYVPDGYAHGFLVISDVAIVMNHSTGHFRPELESGVRYDSIDFEWPIANPIVSEKDKNQMTLFELLQ
jgi:dTDP-4-dehydrorhamnose 3,5-epimerase